MDIKQVVVNYIEGRTDGHLWEMPDVSDALHFLTTEVGEAVEAHMRSKPEYVRNNPDKKYDLGKELADVVFMAFVTAHVAGVDIYAQLGQMVTSTRLGGPESKPSNR